MRYRLVIASAAVVGALAVSAQTIATPAEVVVSDIAVLDVASGQWLAGRDIVVRGTRIERIEAGGGALPPAKTTIAGRGKFAIPALIGGPVRVGGLSAGDAQRVLSEGITTVLDAGTDAARVARWRQDLNTGRIYAPRIASGCGAGAPASGASSVMPAAPWTFHDALARRVSSGEASPAEAIRDATWDRARRYCAADLGAIAEGRAADFVVLSANPLDDLRHLRDIDAVVFRGEVLTYAHLQMLRRGTLPPPTPSR